MNQKERSGKRPGVTKKGNANKKNSGKNRYTKSEITEFDQSLLPLMPELDELVKKNPNRLIGCGG